MTCNDCGREIEAALVAIRDFEPVTNGEYAVQTAIPKMREIAMRALVEMTAPSGGAEQ
jgi:hypothetical protein